MPCSVKILLISSKCMCRWDPPGSFVNDGWTISMKPVSLGNMTHIHMTGKFLTEPEHVVCQLLSCVCFVRDWCMVTPIRFETRVVSVCVQILQNEYQAMKP